MAFFSSDNIIKSVKTQIGLDEKTYTVFKIWDDILGPLAKNARLTEIRRGQLIIDVASSSHFHELNIRKKELLKKINQYFGGEKVAKSLKIRIEE